MQTAIAARLTMLGDLTIPYALNGRIGNMSDLPVEKQFTHTIFCQQIQNIDLESAKQLLVELHHLYLAQQAMMVKIAKQDFRGLGS